MTSPQEDTPPAPRNDWFDTPPKPSQFEWRRDLTCPYLTHFANINRYLHKAAGLRWVFAVCDSAVDLDMPPEYPGLTERCPDCQDWARQHGHLDQDPEARETRRQDALTELDQAINEDQP